MTNKSQEERKLAGMSLEALRDQYRQDLFEDFLPFADQYVVDHELGGFMCNADRDGARISETKNTWFNGRGIWTYAFLYNHIDKKPEYLDIARKAVAFMLNTMPPQDRLWAKNFTRDGAPVGGPDTEIYSDLFVAIGLAEYARAVQDEAFWDIARKLMLKCVKIYDRPGYGAGPVGKDLPATSGARILGHWMILLWLATQMLTFKEDPDVTAMASRCVDAIMNSHFNPDFGLLNEVINHDLSRPDNDLAQYVCTGHAIETLWMVMAEAERTGDAALFDLAAERFRRHVDVAWDDVYGGVLHTLKHVDDNVWDLGKHMWVQEEVLTGAMVLIERTESAWASEMFSRTFAYAKENLWLKKYGHPLQMRSADRKATFVPHASNIDVFHNPRHLMFNLLNLDRMLGHAPPS